LPIIFILTTPVYEGTKVEVANTKTIYLTAQDLKDAIVVWLSSKGEQELANHLSNNLSEIERCPVDNNGIELIVSIDGEIFENDKLNNNTENTFTPVGDISMLLKNLHNANKNRDQKIMIEAIMEMVEKDE